MHRVSTESGALDAERELHLIQQTPADIVFVSAADTDLACVTQAWKPLFGNRLRVTNAKPLQQPRVADDYAHRVLQKARLVILRLLGGKAYFDHLLEELLHLKAHTPRPQILLLPGTDSWDMELMPYGDFPESMVQQLFGYFRESGLDNVERAGIAIQLLLEGRNDAWPEVVPTPMYGWYHPEERTLLSDPEPQSSRSIAWICFYRAWYQTGDLEVINALWDSLEAQGFQVEGFYAYSLRHPEAQNAMVQKAEAEPPQVILTLQSFSVGMQDIQRVSFLETLGCPVLQVPVSTHDRHAWEHNPRGLTPSEVAMNVALPEIDGRVLGTVIGFKEEYQTDADVEFTLKRLLPDPSQIQYVAELAWNWAKLKRRPNAQKRIAIILANYPNKDSRLGNGVGLDTPASVVNFLKALEDSGYQVTDPPEDGEALMNFMQAGITNDVERSYGKACEQFLPHTLWQQCLQALPQATQEHLMQQWSDAEREGFVEKTPQGDLPVAGKQFGNVFIGIQPPRGFAVQTQAIYHSPDLPPPPEYIAFYLWIREVFQADAIVHFGKHGNLEWLPGRSVALGSEDFPRICIGPTPHLYPFIVNNPGEGTQAKRRASAVIIDHLTPPLARAGLYEDLEKIERLLEEHAHCETLYPERAHELEHEIEHILAEASWRDELPQDEDWLNALGNYLCEIKESQIRSGLHIFGQAPEGQRKLDFLLSLLRMPSAHYPGLLQSLLDEDSSFDLNSLAPDQRDALHQRATQWIEEACKLKHYPQEAAPLSQLRELLYDQLQPRLHQCQAEMDNLLFALQGRFIAPGPSGAPTRGRIDVLPTGRNFFSIDPRVIPTPTSWKCGKDLAEKLLQRYQAEHGEYPKNIAMVIWGTSNMRTGGDDIAQALWLWGVEPVWEKVSGRIIDFEIWPAHLLGRPRVDVLLRVSGLFRDAFGDTMRLLATIPKRLAQLDEPGSLNPIRAAWLKDRKTLIQEQVSEETADDLAHLRVFSSGPGCYGTGLLPLIDAGNWETKADLTQVFLKWGGHAYGTDGQSSEQLGLLQNRLSQVEVVHQNQDNREHDILDSDDYFQFQGGLHAAVEQIRGQAPITYHGDSSVPDQVKIRSLSEEFNRVFRSRVLNPRWIDAMRQHGYKGAFEMAATTDYIFGYDATCDIVSDAQYEDLAQKLFLNAEQQEFFKRHNPTALQDAVQRLLEAHERGLWQEMQPETLEALENTLLELEGHLE